MSWGHFQRPACRQLFIRIGHHKTAGVKLAGGLTDIFLIFGKFAIAGDIHTINISFWFAMDHPFGKRFADTPALKEAGHHCTGTPIALFARNRPDKRIAVRRKGKGAIDPGFHANFLQNRISFKTEGEFMFDPVGLFLE